MSTSAVTSRCPRRCRQPSSWVPRLINQMAMHPAQVFAAGTKMQMVILPPPGCTWRHWFSAGMEIELMLMAMLPTVPEFPARMDMSQQ